MEGIINNIAGKDVSTVTGLAEQTVNLEPQTSFGQSGDMFDHLPWRNVFILLSQMPDAFNQLLCLANNLLLRGKSYKINHKASCLKFSVPLDHVNVRSNDAKKMFGNKTIFSLYLNMATESSKVGSKCLTPERMKCLFRVILTPMLVQEGRLPATSESIGYANLSKIFEKLHNLAKGSNSNKAN